MKRGVLSLCVVFAGVAANTAASVTTKDINGRELSSGIMVLENRIQFGGVRGKRWLCGQAHRS
mgnify:FL=1